MVLDRLPISISHLFEIHCSTNTEAAHSIDGTSVYLTVDMLQSAASDVFGETKFSLRIVPDVNLNSNMIGDSTLMYNSGVWMDSASKVAVKSFVFNSNTINDTDGTIVLSVANTGTFGVVMLAADNDKISTNKASTPKSLSTLFNAAVNGGLIVFTNIPEGKFYLDSDDSKIYTNGTIVKFLTAGDHTVRFMPVNGYLVPSQQHITMIDGKFVSAVGNYTKSTRKITCLLSEKTGTWKYEGSSVWLSSGQSAEVSPGTYTVQFSEVNGRTASSQTVTVGSNDMTVHAFYN